MDDEKYFRALQTYRAEDKHKCDLLSKRLSMFLTSQSFFVAAAAVIYARMADTPGRAAPPIAFLAVVAFAIVWFTSVAVCVGCQVLRQWHYHGTELITEAGDIVRGHYLPKRKGLPDWGHKVSVDWFSIGIPVILGIAWMLVLFCCVYLYVFSETDARIPTLAAPAPPTNLLVPVRLKFVFIPFILVGISWFINMWFAWKKAGNLWEKPIFAEASNSTPSKGKHFNFPVG